MPVGAYPVSTSRSSTAPATRGHRPRRRSSPAVGEQGHAHQIESGSGTRCSAATVTSIRSERSEARDAAGAAVAIATWLQGDGYWTVSTRAATSSRLRQSRHVRWPTALRSGSRIPRRSCVTDGEGLLVFTDRGRAFGYRDAHTYGDLSAVVLNGPIVASVATPTGHGYSMVGTMATSSVSGCPLPRFDRRLRRQQAGRRHRAHPDNHGIGSSQPTAATLRVPRACPRIDGIHPAEPARSTAWWPSATATSSWRPRRIFDFSDRGLLRQPRRHAAERTDCRCDCVQYLSCPIPESEHRRRRFSAGGAVP